jgi:hypothetical protein
MNAGSWLLWGGVATAVLTTLMAASQGLRLTRMNIPYMLGTMFTPHRDRASLAGFVFHFGNGWLFSLIYVAAFQSWHRASRWLGAAVGVVHAAFVLSTVMPLLPALHARIASERHGPELTPQLEPPGFLALNYGARTPLSVLAAHIAYGAILGAFYSLR